MRERQKVREEDNHTQRREIKTEIERETHIERDEGMERRDREERI